MIARLALVLRGRVKVPTAQDDLPHSANSGLGPHAPVTMTNSLKRGTVFISGDGRLVVPVE